MGLAELLFVCREARERLYVKQAADGIPHAFGNGQEAVRVE